MAAKRNAVGRFKRDHSSGTPSLFTFFKRSDESESAETICRSIFDDIISSVTGSTEENNARGKKHSGITVSEKTVKSWQDNFPWLIVNGEGVDVKLLCKTCNEMKVKSIWSQEGSANIQRNSVERHGKSAEHLQAEKSLLKKLNPESICEEEDSIDNETHVSSDDLKLFKTVFYVCKEELPSDKVNSLLELQCLNGASIKYKNLSYVTINEIQSCISSVLQRNLVDEIKQSDTYAVMVDESTDLAVQKHLSVCVRYEKNGKPETKFLANISLEDGKAHTIVNSLISCLTDLGLDPAKIVSLATDGAATMTGKRTGVGVQMKAKHSPFAVQTHCIAHRLNLAVTDSIKKLDVLKKFSANFNSLYLFISGSSNRVDKLNKIQNILGEPELTVKEPHSIRWLGLQKAVEAVYQSYSSVLATLSYFSEEKQPQALGLFKYFSRFKTVLLVAFMLDVHETLGVLSKQLQKRTLLFSEIQPLMEGTVGRLEALETKPGQAEKSMRDCLRVEEETDRKAAFLDDEKLRNYSENAESELTNLKKSYIENLKKNIKHRFRKEDSEVFTDFSLLLEPSVVNTASSEQSEGALEALGTLYSSKETTIVHGDMTDGTTEERNNVPGLIDIDKLQTEWHVLRGMVTGSYKNLSMELLCQRVIQLHCDMLPEFCKLCKVALCIAVTSVECERSFSAQNRIKSKYRCSLKTENLQYLLNIQMNSMSLSDYDPVKAVRLWTAKKKRRRRRLCQPYKERAKKAKTSC